MLISVVIPCFKDADTLGRALASVISQTQYIDEIIVVNDASPETKKIESILETFPQVKYILNKENIGLAATRNVGVKAASGEIISFLDADDELHPQKIELQLALHRLDRAVGCGVLRIDTNVEVENVSIYSATNIPFKIYTNSSMLVTKNVLTGASLMVARKLFLEVGGYDESLRSCEDFDLWLRLLDHGTPVYNVELPLYFYRNNPNGLSRNFLNISYWEFEVLKKYFRSKNKFGLHSTRETIILTLWIFKHLVRYEECKDPKLLEKIYLNFDDLKFKRFVRFFVKMAFLFGVPRAILFFKTRNHC